MKKPEQFFIAFFIVFCFCLSTAAQNYSKLSDFPEEIKKSKPFKRFEWYYQQRAFPNNTIPYEYANKVFNAEIQKIKESTNRSDLDWTPKGPTGVEDTVLAFKNWGVVSGRVRSIAVHPDDPEIIYIGAAGGGIWKSTDGGENWTDIGKDLESLNYGAIAIDPNDPDIIYAGAGEAMFLLFDINFGGRGLFKSTDAGDSWSKIGDEFGAFTHFSDIVVHQDNSNILFAALGSGCINMGDLGNEGVWKSTDGGDTFYPTLDLQDAFDILIHPDNPDIIYACIGGSNDNSGIYKSTDMGETWVMKNSGLESYSIGRVHIDISLSSPQTMYAVIFDFSDFHTKAFKTIDGAENWVQISEGINLGGNWGGWYDQGFYDLCIAIDPLDNNHVFIGNVELHETTDGENFIPVRPYGNDASGSIAHVDYHKLIYALSDPNYFYIGCDGGVYQSTDGGVTAESRSEGLETFQFYRMDSHPHDPDIMIGGLQDNGTVMTRDGGITWQMVMTGDGMECFFNNSYPDSLVYASYNNGYLRRSKDGGKTFHTLRNVAGAWVTPYFAHTQNPDTLYTANTDIWEKPPNNNFSRITNDLSPVLIIAMAQNAINPKHMILGTGEAWDTINLVMISTDGGYNWTDVSGNIPGETRWISRVVTHPYDENTMYVVRCGFSETNKIYQTSDLGETWINISGDLPDIPCNDLFIDPWNTDHIYVGTDLGVYRSEDNGLTYQFAGDGMPLVPVLDFDYVKIDETRYLRVATHGRSIYETINLPVGFTENILHPQTWIKISPNPFINSTTIHFNLEQPKTVRITFYNQFGKLVDQIEQKQPVGKQQVTWNAEAHPAGIYYFRLEAAEQFATGKLILMK